MATTHHVGMNIENALKMRSLNFLQDENGNFLSTKAAKQFLREERAKGKKYLTSSSCDNQDADGVCLGHPVVD